MKFLSASFRVPEQGPEWARVQWVIPAPHLENLFVDVDKGETCIAAVVQEAFEPDAAWTQLCAAYPGLPAELLRYYIVQTAAALNSGEQLPAGTRVRVFCNATSAKLQDTATQKFCTLWDELETEKYLN